MMDTIKRFELKMDQGSTKDEAFEEIEVEDRLVGIERAKEEGKYWGFCGTCDHETVLVQENDLCGPCCFGESATYNGNW